MSGMELGRKEFLESHKAKRQFYNVYITTNPCTLIINRGKQKQREEN